MDILELTDIRNVENYIESLSQKKNKTIAIDIECEMNLHCYGEHLCLIQIYDQNNKVIIDPLHIRNKEELVEILKLIFENRNILKIAYDAAGDASVIEKLYGVKFKSILDLKPAVNLLKYEKQGLGNVLQQELSIPPISKKRFQKYNWMRRPLDPEALEYAMSDVIYLFKLKDILMDRIINAGLLEQYMLLNLMAQNKDYVPANPAEIYKKRPGYNRLPSDAKKRYRKLYDIREEYAKQINRPPNFIINNAKLLPLSKKAVESGIYLSNNINRRISEAIRNKIIQNFLEALR